MSKNAEGWIRHRGGKCPVEIGTHVDVRYRGGHIDMDVPAQTIECHADNWLHTDDKNSFDARCDIMAYRLHKPAEQVSAMEKIANECGALSNLANKLERNLSGPLQWRDRITTIDATTQALTTERAELVQKLASEGFALIGRVVEPVEDYGNIQIGDLVSVISIGGFSDCTGLSVGDIAEVTSVDNDESIKTVSGGSWGSIGYNYKFHSRPSA